MNRSTPKHEYAQPLQPYLLLLSAYGTVRDPSRLPRPRPLRRRTIRGCIGTAEKNVSDVHMRGGIGKDGKEASKQQGR